MTDIDSAALVLLGIAATAMSVAALLLKNLIRAVVSFALASTCVAGMFFLMSSPFAGALEITVGAGLVAVLFLVTLVLSGGTEEEVPE